ncbi:hypothetical protein [Aureimonas sp. SK2]|uniref:hypothetical protein n=1 Tax=Aureimonas sp. SK2 TaxID=3015992 RepID=UPI0024449012|nr:hypothetical protein [Aureimonas sp. SK2]
MPKKKQIKRDKIVTDAGLVLDAEQAAMVRKQVYEGSYGLDAPDITVTDDDITVRVGATVYTVYGDSPLHTTTVLRRSESSYTPAALRDDDVGYAVRDAIERTRDAALATIESVNEEWAANVGEFDDIEGDDGDEGLREGPVVGSGPSAGFISRSALEAVPSLAELKHRKAHAEALIAECKAAELVREDTITLPNAEYAELLATARRDAAFRAAFTGVVATDDSEVDLEALNAAFAGIPAGPYDAILHSAGWEVRQLDTDPTDKHHWPVRLCQGIAGQKAGFDGAAANFIAGVLNAWPLIAARLAATEGETASDVSDAAQDDGGPVEPGLDIDTLVAAAVVGEFPMTAVDPVDALAAAAIEGAAPFAVSSDGATVSVEGSKVRLTYGGNTFETTAAASVIDDLRKALASAKSAGGFR